MEWKAGSLISMDTDWNQVNTFRIKIEEITKCRSTKFRSPAWIYLIFNQDGMTIRIEKEMWIKPQNTLHVYNSSAFAVSNGGNYLAQVRVYEKNWFCKSPHHVIKNLPKLTIDPYEISTTINLLKTASGKEAIDAAHHLFYVLEIEPAYYDKEHWLRHVLPSYWQRWEKTIDVTHTRQIEDIMTT